MNRSRHAVQFTLLCFFSLLLFVTGCRKPNARLTAGHGSASIEAPNQLLTVLAISNEGSAPAEDIQITSISTPGAALTVPSSLPISLGTLAPEADSDLDANFTLASPKPDNTYSITLAGTFREDGHRFKFSLTEDVRTPPASPGSGTSFKGTAPSNHVTGAPYPPQKPNFGSEVNEGGEGRRVPTGPKRPLVPSKESGVQSAPKGSGGGGGGTASINFPTNAPVGINSSTTAEPSGASGGGVIFETANWYAAYSTDGGTTFTKLDPTTIFPNTTDGGFCCDQVVQYVPSIDRFVWVMQYGPASPAPSPNPKNLPTNGPGLYRVASASPAEVKSSKGTGWSYFDITSQAVLESANTPWLDYPDTSFGNTYLYLSADDVNNGGHVIVRISLADIKAGGTINFGYTKPSDSGVAWGGHLSQNTGDTIYWAGHNNSSIIRVFDWPESSNNYNWRDISIGSWPNTSSSNLMTSTTPDGLDWLNKMSGFPGNAVLGLARSSAAGDNKQSTNQLILAWTGAIGSGFKQPQVQWIALDLNNNYKLISQQQVWNSGYAYAYPAFAVNSRNEIGMSLEWGGGGNYENHVAGFWGDYVVYSTTNSAIGTKRFGDYVTIRNNSADATRFDAFGYGLNKDSSGNAVSDVHYLIFSR